MARLSDKGLYLHVTTPLDDSERKFVLDAVEGGEGISELFHYTLSLRSRDNGIDFASIVGKSVTASIEMFNTEKRCIDGFVSRFVQGENDGGMTAYRAEIVPWTWRLTLTANSRIYQEMKTGEILSEIFSDFGFSDFRFNLRGSYKPREYCVQYEETAFNFISRLMEEDGMFYFFEHEPGKHTLVISDALSAHKPCPGLGFARFGDSNPDGSDEVIGQCSLEQQVISNKFAVQDYNFELPDNDLLSRLDTKESGAFRVYTYPGGFEKIDEGEKIADRRVEAIELPEKILKGSGFCRAFIAGYRFEMRNHDRADMNGEYVLRRLSVSATQDGYANFFEAFPADVQFRPPMTARKPRISGTQTAEVVGKSGEEIWTDEYGRIKVQFHWDEEGTKDENSSCWIRVTHNWAGKGWGTVFIPRIGMEVAVTFLEGDPDRPLVTGAVYNAKQSLPYRLPAEKTKSTVKTDSTIGGGGSNEIRFEDKKGSEEIYAHAQKDLNEVVENNMATHVKVDQELTVDNNRTKTVSGNETISVGKNREETVNGTQTETIKKDASLTVSEGNHTQTVQSGTSTTTVAKDIVITTNESRVHVTAATEILLQVGESAFLMKQDGSIMLRGNNIAVEGAESVNIHGGAVTSEADADHNTRGRIVVSDGSATNTVRGGMVMLNP